MSGDKKGNKKTGTSWKSNSTNTEAHVTHYDKEKNTRRSYDIKNDKSGGWRITNAHTTDQNKSKRDKTRHK